jgi:flagellar hook-basal body complex protein FliE
MMIDPISIASRGAGISSLRNGGLGGGSLAGGTNTGGASFGDTLKQAIGKVSEAQETSAANVGAFLRGENVELHQVMAASEEAGIALEMMIEVRNKFTEAYRTVINMQS